MEERKKKDNIETPMSGEGLQQFSTKSLVAQIVATTRTSGNYTIFSRIKVQNKQEDVFHSWIVQGKHRTFCLRF